MNLRDEVAIVGEDEDRPPLYYGNVLELLTETPERVPGRCTALYFVRPDAEEEFLREMNGGRLAGCGGVIRYQVLGE